MSYRRRNRSSYRSGSSYGEGRRGGGRNFGGPKPVEVGKEYDVQVTETSYRGNGVARIQGFVVFVKNGKAGGCIFILKFCYIKYLY
jgi:predicted RNA-binding protein with TRAM domain